MTTSHPSGYPYYGVDTPPPAMPPPRRTGRNWLIGLGGGAIAAALVVGGVAVASSSSMTIAGSGSAAQLLPVAPGTSPSTGSPDTNGSPRRASSAATAATAMQQVGIVTVVSVLKYQNAEGSGTGMVLTPDGEVLTNNHVVNGATSVTVTVESSGKSYRADVVGTAPGNDVAVLHLRNASGLATARVADSSSGAAVGDAVTGVGNAGGTGTLTAASGSVTALGQSITASDATGQDAERLTGLIQIDAKIIAGDSGGPLYNAGGEIIGMNTAASVRRSATQAAYAIPIENAKGIADRIETGIETASIHIGYPGFLGISTKNSTNGAAVGALLPGGPAAAAGITAGSTITAINGNQVSSATALRAVLAGKDPGSKVTVTWADATGTSHSASVTLATGPAD